jgi:hypothetical protein
MHRLCLRGFQLRPRGPAPHLQTRQGLENCMKEIIWLEKVLLARPRFEEIIYIHNKQSYIISRKTMKIFSVVNGIKWNPSVKVWNWVLQRKTPLQFWYWANSVSCCWPSLLICLNQDTFLGSGMCTVCPSIQPPTNALLYR